MNNFPRMHISLYVADIKKTVAFYNTFFNVEADKVKDDYAKYVRFSIFNNFICTKPRESQC